ncbi:GNAT family N-acetyltransferase [Thioclava sp. GXIMD4216]|uniref:GNAT family N-acetyltransferase n=1 Tax=Thioclava sp. GXIMD4216 TaxID=3131929 RepID=UPI0030D10DC8
MIALSPTPVLHSAALVLRAPAAHDYPHWRDFQASPRSVFIRPAPEFDEGLVWRAWAAVIGHWVMHGWGPFVVTPQDSDRGLGLVGPWQPHGWPEAEILWNLWDGANEGRGLMAEAAAMARAHLYTDLGWDSVVSYVDAANSRSAALAERLGCRLDPQAATPLGKPCLVYRHPKPEDLA